MSNGWRQSFLALACYCTGLSASLMAESQAFVDGAISVPLKDAGHDASKPRPADYAAVRILPEHVPPPEIPSGELEAFGDYLEELWRDLGIPGCAIAVMQEDRVILQRTLGLRNVTRKEPVDAQTLFNIGPATMAFSRSVKSSYAATSMNSCPSRFSTSSGINPIRSHQGAK